MAGRWKEKVTRVLRPAPQRCTEPGSSRKPLTCVFRLQSLQESRAWKRETPGHLCCSQKRCGPQSAPASWGQRSLQGGGFKDEEGPKSTAEEGAEEKAQAEVSGAAGPEGLCEGEQGSGPLPASWAPALPVPEGLCEGEQGSGLLPASWAPALPLPASVFKGRFQLPALLWSCALRGASY